MPSVTPANRKTPETIRAHWLLTVLFLALCAGCSRDREAPSPQLQYFVAAWQGGTMTLGEWLHNFRELQNPDQIDSQNMHDSILQLCHEWVAEKILAERARENGMHRDPAMVEQLADFREERMVNLFLRENIDEQITIKRNSLKDFYDQNQDRFRTPATYSYYRIFFSNDKNGIEDAKKRAEECWRMIEKGANFHDMLAEYSDTREDKKYLEYGPFKAGEMPSEIEQVILKTPLRRHSDVVATPGGYMILYPEKKTDAIQQPFSNVEPTIYQELFQKEQKEKTDLLFKKLSEKYQVVTHKELFDAAEVKPESILLEIKPAGATYSWGDFSQFADAQKAVSRAEKESALEVYGRQKLLLHHVRQIKFAETDYFRKRFRPVETRILSDFYMQQMVDAKIDLSEEEILAYYEEHPDEFRRPARVEAWHLAKKIRTPVNASEKDRATEEQKVLGQLLEIRHRVAEQGESFLTWANRFTDYEDGGYLGWQSMLALPPEWISVVATLEEGEISMPIRVKDTFELVLRGGLEEPGVMKFEVARDKVVERAREKKIAKTRREYLEALLGDVAVSYDVKPAMDVTVRLLDRLKRPPQYWLDPYQ